jgi:hypothetical protein
MKTRTKVILVVSALAAGFILGNTINGNLVVQGTVSSGQGSGKTGLLNLTGKTSGKTSTITVDDSNTATQVNLPNDTTSGLYFVTSPTATPAAGCAQFNGTSSQAASTGSPCGSGGGGGANVDQTAFASTPSCTTTPFVDFITDAGLVGYCNGSSSLKWKYGRVNAVPLSSNPFTGFNAPSISVSKGGAVLTGSAGAGNNLQGELIAVPSTPYVQIACFEVYASESYAQGGMIWTNGTNTSTSGIIYFANLVSATTPANVSYSLVQLAHQTGVSGSASQYAGTTEWTAGLGGICFGMQDDGTTALKYAYSFDRQTWNVVLSTSRTDIFTPSDVGVYVNTSSANTVPKMHLFSWESVSGTLF